MQAANILISILRSAWTAIMGLMVAVAIISMLIQFLRLSGSAAIGAALYVNRAVASITGLIVLALYTFLAIPVVVHAISSHLATDACGPAADLGAAAAYVIAAISAVRMAKSAFITLLSALAGSADGISFAMMDGLEALLGVVLVSIAVPVSAAFLGAC